VKKLNTDGKFRNEKKMRKSNDKAFGTLGRLKKLTSDKRGQTTSF
jgi:hypothetical protein